MIRTIEDLLYEYRDYANPYTKIGRMEKQGGIIRLKRGLYTDSDHNDPLLFAQFLYSPSYISFETALSYHGMIPEKVTVIRSATLRKNRSREFTNHFGVYLYEDIPEKAFPYGIESIPYDSYAIPIASKEKCLTDYLYKIAPQRSQRDIRSLLFEDLRLNENVFASMDFEVLKDLCDLYRCSTTKTLKRCIEKEYLSKYR